MPPKSDYVIPKTSESYDRKSKTVDVKKTESKPKFNDAPIIEEWVSDSESEEECETESKQRRPSCACGTAAKKVNTAKHVETARESDKKEENFRQSPRRYN